MNLYPDELKHIIAVTKAYQRFAEFVTTQKDVEWDGELYIVVYDCNGKPLGKVGWTDDGSVGFIVNDEEQGDW